MKTLTKTFALAMGVALVSPLLMAPTAVNGSLSGFSGGTPGGQTASGWGINSGQTPKGDQGDSGNSGQTPKGEQGNSGNSGQTPKGQQGDSGNSGQTPDGEQGSNQDPYDPSEDHKQHPDEDGDSTDRSDDHKQHPDEDTDSTDRSNDHKQHPDDGDGSNGSNSGSSSSGGSSSGGSSSSSSGGGSSDPYPPLDPTQDPQYEPDNSNDGQVPSGCADAGSPCADCVRRHEAAIQFNRNYLHIAWSISKQTHEMAKKALAFGDGVSGIHATQGLAWQLGGRPQIEEAIANHRKVYTAKYRVYLGHIQDSLAAMARCETDNFAVSDLYRRYGFLYTEFIKSRYESAE